ncbi:MAG: flavin reductase family protein [Kiloniellales bacterium]|nr:flavin reductase family protein [Kiloniellales bacterium]
MVDEEIFRKGMSHFVTGVTVVTTNDGDDGLAGFTANAFTSLSVSPPQILICLSLGLRSYPILRESGRFGVHVLAEDQADVARIFARRGADKGNVVGWSLNERAVPVLGHYLAFIDCDLVREYDGSDHVIAIGLVRDLDLRAEDMGPLLYYRGQIGGLDIKPGS